jgi:hypothetical protein
MDSERLVCLLERIDQLNSQDPNKELVNGVAYPRELLYAQRVTGWILRLNPNASEALRITARGQHIQRWTIPRNRYEPGRRGYLRWRETLKAFHIQQVTELMREAGYAGDEMARVGIIMSKRQLETDADTQTLEDALCLVFLETQFDELRAKTPHDTMLAILQKTWRKMSPQARALAEQLALSDDAKGLLGQALSGPTQSASSAEGAEAADY